MRRKIRIELYSVHKDCDCAKGRCQSKASEPQQNQSLFPQFVRAEVETLKRNNANGIVRISKINSAPSVFPQIHFNWFLQDCWCPGCTIAAGAKFSWWIESIFQYIHLNCSFWISGCNHCPHFEKTLFPDSPKEEFYSYSNFIQLQPVSRSVECFWVPAVESALPLDFPAPLPRQHQGFAMSCQKTARTFSARLRVGIVHPWGEKAPGRP